MTKAASDKFKLEQEQKEAEEWARIEEAINAGATPAEVRGLVMQAAKNVQDFTALQNSETQRQQQLEVGRHNLAEEGFSERTRRTAEVGEARQGVGAYQLATAPFQTALLAGLSQVTDPRKAAQQMNIGADIYEPVGQNYDTQQNRQRTIDTQREGMVQKQAEPFTSPFKPKAAQPAAPAAAPGGHPGRQLRHDQPGHPTLDASAGGPAHRGEHRRPGGRGQARLRPHHLLGRDERRVANPASRAAGRGAPGGARPGARPSAQPSPTAPEEDRGRGRVLRGRGRNSPRSTSPGASGGIQSTPSGPAGGGGSPQEPGPGAGPGRWRKRRRLPVPGKHIIPLDGDWYQTHYDDGAVETWHRADGSAFEGVGGGGAGFHGEDPPTMGTYGWENGTGGGGGSTGHCPRRPRSNVGFGAPDGPAAGRPTPAARPPRESGWPGASPGPRRRRAGAGCLKAGRGRWARPRPPCGTSATPAPFSTSGVSGVSGGAGQSTLYQPGASAGRPGCRRYGAATPRDRRRGRLARPGAPTTGYYGGPAMPQAMSPLQRLLQQTGVVPPSAGRPRARRGRCSVALDPNRQAQDIGFGYARLRERRRLLRHLPHRPAPRDGGDDPQGRGGGGQAAQRLRRHPGPGRGAGGPGGPAGGHGPARRGLDGPVRRGARGPRHAPAPDGRVPGGEHGAGGQLPRRHARADRPARATRASGAGVGLGQTVAPSTWNPASKGRSEGWGTIGAGTAGIQYGKGVLGFGKEQIDIRPEYLKEKGGLFDPDVAPGYIPGSGTYNQYDLSKPGLFQEVAGQTVNSRYGLGGTGDPTTGGEVQTPSKWITGNMADSGVAEQGDAKWRETGGKYRGGGGEVMPEPGGYPTKRYTEVGMGGRAAGRRRGRGELVLRLDGHVQLGPDRRDAGQGLHRHPVPQIRHPHRDRHPGLVGADRLLAGADRGDQGRAGVRQEPRRLEDAPGEGRVDAPEHRRGRHRGQQRPARRGRPGDGRAGPAQPAVGRHPAGGRRDALGAHPGRAAGGLRVRVEQALPGDAPVQGEPGHRAGQADGQVQRARHPGRPGAWRPRSRTTPVWPPSPRPPRTARCRSRCSRRPTGTPNSSRTSRRSKATSSTRRTRSPPSTPRSRTPSARATSTGPSGRRSPCASTRPS